MARNKEQVRRTKRTRRRLPVRQLSVAAQSAAALALGLGLAAPAPAEASIVYTNIADVFIQNGQTYNLDLTNSGNNQFTFYFQNGTFPYYGLNMTYVGPKMSANNNNYIVGKYFYAFLPGIPNTTVSNLPKNTMIGYGLLGNNYQYPIQNGHFAGKADGTIYGVPFSLTVGEWIGKQGYAGLIFQDEEGDIHFGWVELLIPSDLSSITIFGYAYESTPYQDIAAGAVPIPSSLLLLGTGALGVLAYRRRGRRAE